MKFALLTIIWWARVVPTHLLPKETDLQSAAVADLLLTHIWYTQGDSNPYLQRERLPT